jgi:tetratricopeptide (TPR) repeat protein
MPTEAQINSLRVFELRAACAERGLIMTGKKAELQQRLIIWSTVQERERAKERLTGLRDLIRESKDKRAAIEAYDVDALTNKRKGLTKEKKRSGRGKNNRGILGLVDESFFNSTTTGVADMDEDEDEDDYEEEDDRIVDEASISQLSKSFNAPSSAFSNREVREMYIEAKAADQAGDRARSKAILVDLRQATPHDMRVIRRLARMEQEDGNISKARTILKQGLQLEPDNAHLLHGLGQLERTAGNDNTARKYFQEATTSDPEFPNPYHALGTLEHTHGNIRAALAVIKEGISHCPQNHRLHHALGDVYLDANMLDLAEEAYLSGLQHAPHWGKSFFYTSLSYVSYAQGQTKDCRTLLHQSLQVNGGMHAQGVIALAQLEESEGNIVQAREVYRDAVSRYEKKRRRRSRASPKQLERENDVFDTSSLVDAEGNQYSKSYSGDKWINVFKSWARMEDVHGTYETAHIVFSKAARLFPNNIGLLIQWAELLAEHGDTEKARLLYEAACHRVGGKSADPYRLYAEVEMRQKHFAEAKSILFRGVQAVADSKSYDSKGVDLAWLFHTWGVCEYHLGNLPRSEKLFENALRVSGSEEEDSAMRSLILYSMARLEFSRNEYLLAQHCIALSLKENLLPGGNSLIWKLWSQIAEKMGNKQLLRRCKEQAFLRWEEERGGAASDLSRLLDGRDDGRLPERTGSAMKGMFRKTPWYSKVCPQTARMDKNWHSGAKLWEL